MTNADQPATDLADQARSLVSRVTKRERRAIAEALTAFERQAADIPALLAALQPHLGRAAVIGITGPPGAGKSTLVNALIAHVRDRRKMVAVLAVDPSSPVSGGAILGDRVRMTAALDDDGVFVRSLASRGSLGGLTPAAVRMIDVLDAAAFDLILIETVGTGQSEIDVAEVADVRVVVAAPGLGDDIQAMKAGLLEIADILVVNKADREGAEQTLHQLRGAVSLRAGGGDTPVLKVSALTGAGISEFWSAIESEGTRRLADGLEARRKRRARYLIARVAADLIAARIRKGDSGDVDALCAEVLSGKLAPAAAAKRLIGG